MRGSTRGTLLVGLCLGVVIAGGASVYTLRASGARPVAGDPGCPPKERLINPIIDFEQERDYYVHVTLTNPNDCYGFQDEPVEITLYGPNGRRAISYYGEGPPHSEVGVCCNVTLPPHGTWTIRLGGPVNPQGKRQVRICNVHVEALRSKGYDVWKRMPDGGAVAGRGSFPPDFVPKSPDPSYTPAPHWRAPCVTPSP